MAGRGRPKKKPARPCSICGEFKEHDAFYKNTNTIRFKSEKVPICKDCIRDYVYDRNKKINVDKLKELLIIIDIPFYQQELMSAELKEKDTVGIYFKNIQLNHSGEGYADGEQEIISKVVEADFDIDEEICKFWGGSDKYSASEIIELNELFMEFKEDFEISDCVQERTIKAICKAEIAADNALASNDIAKFNSLRKSISAMLGDNNMRMKDNKGENDNASIFGMAIKKYETEKPIPDPLFEWKKNDLIRKNIRTFYFGHLCKMIGLKNDFYDEYTEELDKYTVKVEDENEDIENED